MKLCSQADKPIKRFFRKSDIKLKLKAQAVAEKISKKLAHDEEYYGRIFELGSEQDKAKIVIGEKIGAGFNGVVFRIELKDVSPRFKDANPNLFSEGVPRNDLVIKLPRKSGLLKHRQEDSLRNEIGVAQTLDEKLGSNKISSSEVLYPSSFGNEPFIIKTFVNATELEQLAKEQEGKLTDEQKERLYIDIYENAVRLMKETGLALDIKPSNIAWDKHSKKWVMYEKTARKHNSLWTTSGFEGYVGLVENTMKTLLKNSRPPLSMALKTVAAGGAGFLLSKTSKRANPVGNVVSHVVRENMQQHIGDPRALSPETELQIEELYKRAGYWHGTGRYQYTTGRSHSLDKNEGVSDVLDMICKSGQLTPKKDPLEFTNYTENCISLAPERMYARSYADTHSVNPDSQPRYGSSLAWSQIYLGDFVPKFPQTYLSLDKKQRQMFVNNSVGELGLTGWKSKVTKAGFSDSIPLPEKIMKRSMIRNCASLVRPYLSLSDTFRTGSDIPANYPIIFGITPESVTKRANVSKLIAQHEVRSLDSLNLDTSITHIEVPRLNVDETREILHKNGIVHLPVLAIEDCEAYLSRFRVKDVYLHELDKPKKDNPPYEVTGPTIIDLESRPAKKLESSRDLGEAFNWNQSLGYNLGLIPAKYTAGLIPLRRDDNGDLQVLLLKRSKLVLNGGVWATPGGSCNPNKDMNPLMSAIRETKEELGFTPTGEVILDPIVLKDSKSRRSFYGYAWLVDDSTFCPKLNWENKDAKWVSLSKIEPESPEMLGACSAILRHIACSDQFEIDPRFRHTYEQIKEKVLQLHPKQRKALWERIIQRCDNPILRDLFPSNDENFANVFESLAPKHVGEGREKRKALHQAILNELFPSQYKETTSEKDNGRSSTLHKEKKSNLMSLSSKNGSHVNLTLT